MARTKNREITVGILATAAWLLVSLIQSQDAYAEKRVSGSTKSVTQLALDRVSLPDKMSSIYFRIQLWVLSSLDPDWDNAYVFNIRYDHPTKIKGFKSYSAIIHPSGDQTFVKFDGMEESLGGGEAIFEAKGRYIGGTGKFERITGRSTFKLKWTVPETTVEWETEYEVRQQYD